MPDNARRLHLICYDIACPRRLGRIHRYLKGRAAPVQYSVFVAKLNRREISLLAARLAHRIHPRKDDIRIYPLPEKLALQRLGRGAFPEGIYLFAGGVEDFLEALEQNEQLTR
ncbi:CRISPR-associated protein Cas2 [Nitrosococcus halophilus Nc 4]|uniref:CRISPR-associated endoribonuclease Cas2 n=1 Tax=Nitrosococcus halophilus (strain Nc4) TaxID=472759 RepID=D5BXZ9_NITHN|nr:CRISPR-associated endonuclease Cas2 [Nitrosococcus halophilus]ADE15910.1 CRISPR-associated protein Cas2 [Nitrosococcus halophilus Nc 4]